MSISHITSSALGSFLPHRRVPVQHGQLPPIEAYSPSAEAVLCVYLGQQLVADEGPALLPLFELSLLLLVALLCFVEEASEPVPEVACL